MHNIVIYIISICLVLICVKDPRAEIINVPEDQESIMDGIDAAEDGDTVLVAPGEYVENVDFMEKDIVVASLQLITGDDAYIDSTIIDGNRQGACVWIFRVEGGIAQLVGFSITNGSGIVNENGSFGGGIACFNANIRLRNLNIFNNRATFGGGLLVEDCPVEIQNVTIRNNESEVSGGGCNFVSSEISMDFVSVHDNTSEFIGAFLIENECNVVMNHVTISDNSAENVFGAITLLGGSGLTILNSIIWNSPNWEINCHSEGNRNSVTVAYTDIWGGQGGVDLNDNAEIEWGEGNLNRNPRFIAPNQGNYHLAENSPCIDVGDPDSPPDQDGTRTDMGVYPFLQDGTLEGHIFDEADDAPLTGAIVSTSNGQSSQTDEEGFWRIDDALPGEFNITARCQGYNDSTRMNFNLEVDDTLEIDFSLLHPTFISGDEIIIDITLDSSMGVDLTVENDGNGPLFWTVETKLREELDFSPWEQRNSFQVSELVDDPEIEGVVYADNRYYISGEGNDTNRVYILDNDGALISKFDQPSIYGQGLKDLTFDGELIWGSGQTDIFGLNLNGEVDSRFNGPYRSNRALTWDTVNECLWISAENQGIRSYDREGNRLDLLNRCEFLIHGLAFWQDDLDNHQLYIFHSRQEESSQLIHKMNIETEDTMFVADLGELSEGTAGGMFICSEMDQYSWVLMSIRDNDADDYLDIWQLSTNTSWMSIEPDEGILNPGNAVELTLNLDATDLLEDVLYEGRLLFSHNADDGETEILVSMQVTLDVDDQQIDIPTEFELFPAFPNPFNATAKITYSLPVSAEISLQAFDIMGRGITTLIRGQQCSGSYTLTWDASEIPSGLYLVRLEASGNVITQKAMLIR